MRWNLCCSVSLGVISAAIALSADPAWAQATIAPAPPQSGAVDPGQAAAGTSVTAAGNAQADTGSRLQEIVVTAQRRSERLQDVPLAVTAVSATTLAANGITNTQDLNAVIPGLNFTSTAGWSLPRIRGVGSTSAFAGNENAVATYVDGVYIASSSSSLLAFNNISAVDVLKGPQGTLFGRNSTGGVIQVTTLDPSHDLGGDMHVTGGNYGTVGGDLYLTGGLTSNVTADVAALYNDQMEGFGRNLATGQYVNNDRELALRSKVKIDLGATTVTLSGDYAYSNSANPAYRPVDGSIPFNGEVFTGSTYDVDSNYQPLETNKQGGGSITVSHDFGGFKFLSITAYRITNYYVAIDSDRTPQPYLNINIHETDKQFTQEFQLLSNNQGPFRWVLGAYYFNGTTDFGQNLAFPGVHQIYTFVNQKPDSVAGFAQGTYKLTDKLDGTIGVRYTYEDRSFESRGSILTPAGALIAPQVGAISSFDVNKVTYRFALDYHFDKDILGYVSYNRGYKSGGYNPVITAVPYAGEQLDAYETGVKGDFLDKRLRVDVAGYYYNYTNIQVSSYVNGVNNISNAAQASLYGADADITFVPIRHLTFTLGVSLIHDRFGTFNDAVTSIPLVPNGTTVLGGNLVTTASATGNRLPLTPDWTANLGVNYVVPLPWGRMVFDANYYHNDGWYAEVNNRLRQSAYDLVNGSATWYFGDGGRYSFSVWGKNLTDAAYAVTLVSGSTNDAVALAAPRTYGATIGVKF